MRRALTGFARFWWDFVVGEDWRTAAGVLVVLGVGATLVHGEVLSEHLTAVAVGLGIGVVALACLLLPARRAARRGGG